MEEFVGSDSVDEILTELQENLQKYKFMESSKRQSRKTYVMKIPEIKKALDVVSLLAEQGVRQCLFEEMTLIHCPNRKRERVPQQPSNCRTICLQMHPSIPARLCAYG